MLRYNLKDKRSNPQGQHRKEQRIEKQYKTIDYPHKPASFRRISEPVPLLPSFLPPGSLHPVHEYAFVWAAFFAIQLVLWMTLFFILPPPTWYQLITIVPPALIVILFALDWIVRQFLLPDDDKKDALQLTIRAIIKHRQAPGNTISK